MKVSVVAALAAYWLAPAYDSLAAEAWAIEAYFHTGLSALLDEKPLTKTTGVQL